MAILASGGWVAIAYTKSKWSRSKQSQRFCPVVANSERNVIICKKIILLHRPIFGKQIYLIEQIR